MMTDNTETSIPKLVDFGLAKMIGPNEKALEPFGTLGYVAPEVLRKEPYSFSCDLWSLGCILIELYIGVPIFPGESESEQLSLLMEVIGLPDMELLEISSRRANFFEENSN